MSERPIGGRGERLRVYLDEYRGRTSLHVRRWYPDETGDYKPGKGATVPPSLIPFVRFMIVAAEREALERGVIDEEAYQTIGLPLPEELGGEGEAACAQHS